MILTLKWAVNATQMASIVALDILMLTDFHSKRMIWRHLVFEEKKLLTEI